MIDIEDTLRRIAVKSSDRWARFLAAEALAQWRTERLLAMARKQTSENRQDASNVRMAIGVADSGADALEVAASLRSELTRKDTGA